MVACITLAALMGSAPQDHGKAALLRIAVMPVKLDESAKGSVSPALFDEVTLAALQGAGPFSTIGQGDLEAVLGFENQKDALGCDDVSCFADIGGALGVDYLVAATLGRAGDGFTVLFKLIKMKGGAPDIVGRSFKNVTGAQAQLLQALPAILHALLRDSGLPVKEQATAKSSGWEASGPLVLVRFDSEPEGAMVMVNGQLACNPTPCKKSLPEGAYQVEMVRENYDAARASLEVKKGMGEVSLTLAASFGRLSVSSTPSGLAVYVDGQQLGETPAQLELAPGPHEVLVRDPRFYDKGLALMLKKGEERALSFDLVPRQAQLVVTALLPKGGGETRAFVKLDGKRLGETPLSELVLIGAHELELESGAGYYKESLTLAEREERVVNAILKPHVAEASLDDLAARRSLGFGFAGALGGVSLLMLGLPPLLNSAFPPEDGTPTEIPAFKTVGVLSLAGAVGLGIFGLISHNQYNRKLAAQEL